MIFLLLSNFFFSSVSPERSFPVDWPTREGTSTTPWVNYAASFPVWCSESSALFFFFCFFSFYLFFFLQATEKTKKKEQQPPVYSRLLFSPTCGPWPRPLPSAGGVSSSSSGIQQRALGRSIGPLIAIKDPPPSPRIPKGFFKDLPRIFERLWNDAHQLWEILERSSSIPCIQIGGGLLQDRSGSLRIFEDPLGMPVGCPKMLNGGTSRLNNDHRGPLGSFLLVFYSVIYSNYGR